MKTVPHTNCKATGKRSFPSRDQARKAMGRAKAKHDRRNSNRGTRRGTIRENRTYECEHCEGWHLTHTSRAEYYDARAAWGLEAVA